MAFIFWDPITHDIYHQPAPGRERRLMKLFVVGESSPDNETWSRWSEPTFVIAETPERALEVADHFEGKRAAVSELPMDSEMFIWRVTQE